MEVLYVIGFVTATLAAVAAGSALRVVWRRVFRARVKGHVGESKVSKVLKSFTRKGARSRNDVMLKKGYGTSQLDHLLITRQGIVVIETKNYSGTIHGSEDKKLWTQSFPGSHTEPRRFYNPIQQNKGHIHALQGILKDYKDVPYYSLVVFPDHCSFPELPGVISNGALKQAIKQVTAGPAVLTAEQVQDIEGIIDRNSITTRSARSEHNFRAGLQGTSDPKEVQALIRDSMKNSVTVSFTPAAPAPVTTQAQSYRRLLTDTHAKLAIRGKTDTIENFFEKAKRLDDGQPAPVGGSFDYFLCPYTGDKFPASEALNFYQGLWIAYLNKHPELVEHMKSVGTEGLGNSHRCKRIRASVDSRIQAASDRCAAKSSGTPGKDKQFQSQR